MPACSVSSEPNSFTLPRISSSKAFGISMLTRGVNRCACRQRRSQRGALRIARAAGTPPHTTSGCARAKPAHRVDGPGAAAGLARGRGAANKSAVADFERARFHVSLGQGSSSTRRARARPGPGPPALHLEQIEMRPRAHPASATNARLAGEDSNRCRSGRNSTPSAPPASAASFKRRSQRSSVPFNQSKTAAQTPELKACSAAHKASVALAGRTMISGPARFPAAPKPVQRVHGAAQSRPAKEPHRRFCAGIPPKPAKKLDFAEPGASSSTSTSDAVGQPPPGKRASSALRPVDQTGRDERADGRGVF